MPMPRRLKILQLKAGLEPISRLGLLVFQPNIFCNQVETALLAGGLSWIEIQRNDAAFLQFLGEVVDVLGEPNAPGGNPSCQWCGYRDTSTRRVL